MKPSNFYFSAEVLNGGIVNVKPAAEYKKWKAELEGKEIEINIRKKSKKRGIQQNKYYWKVVVEMVYCRLQDLGNRINREGAHDLLRVKFLNAEITDPETGEVLGETLRSTTSLSTTEFNQYKCEIQQWAAEILEIDIPDPITLGIDL